MPIPKNLPGGNLPGAPGQGAGNRPGASPTRGGGLPPQGTGQIPGGNPNDGLPPLPPTRPSRPTVPSAPEPTHVSQYDFDERSLGNGSLPGRGQVTNPYDGDNDDTFANLSVDEQVQEEEQEDDWERQEASRARQERLARQEARARQEAAQRAAQAQEMGPEPTPAPAVDDSEDTPEEEPAKGKRGRRPRKEKGGGEKDSKGQDVFIDPKAKKLKPFGGRKLKENDFDTRKNLQKKRAIVQWVALLAVLVIVGFGFYKTFFPAQAMTPKEVEQIVANSTGMTNFPLEEGQGFATDFMKAYLTVNADPASQQVLGYYYSGTMGTGDSDNRMAASGYKQTVLFGPTVYDAVALTDYSARYTVGALVQPALVQGDTPNGTQARWQFFNVNVYYNEGGDNFSITKDSPTVIPATEVGQSSDIPEQAPLGTGQSDQALGKAVQSVVFGFLDGYSKSSPSNHSTMDQYIVSNPPAALLKGLNGTYAFAGDMNDAVRFEAYPTDDPSVVKVSVRVNWRTTLGADSSNARLEYTSTYVMTLDKQSNGKFLVSKFSPQYFVAKDGVDTSTVPTDDGAPAPSATASAGS